ncbi:MULTISPECIES: phosphoribosylglycinamide formyltransferase [Pelosinus]|uniref:Phosphoribosylglycinamide formyltransferase n=1 Tax=Pelosinus fermentans B4 TaxID=1149862 RepID=I9B427_9FIRM|nr:MULTISPECIES: phosphoribosylglycinamide formyltransferase [Pelosinus]EIW19862.1 phosphoribosylglycinamide formyltransferase [Pelosinus fermentans B4]EIW21281.1 phosphoribosylglycinamide formyltransferase [Pelosinus fermentans A11]OAM95017.1 phosphoribosylglycinamide formyltransferase [Pelosinus fermentans DSM 17108]SDR22040.1 phosphoribosylglycinamide formyltransferase-1 [Pelosinus fermentans]
MSKTILGILASGRGSNMQAICNSIDAGLLDAKVGLVISDKANAKVLEHAAAKGIPAICIERKNFTSKQEFEAAIAQKLTLYHVDLVVLAGFMRILSAYFVNLFSGSIMNIHPSLLPAFPGLDAHEQAIAYGAKVSGCTIHFVDEGMDTGPIIMQQAVSILADDTVETLSERILAVEHELYPQAIRLYCEQRLCIEGRNVKII